MMSFSATLPIGLHTENPEGAKPETVSFCDYASTGNTWRRADSYRTWFPVERGRLGISLLMNLPRVL